MGVVYNMYAAESKDYIEMGKRLYGDGLRPYQMPSDRIAEFVASHFPDTLFVKPDSGNLPEVDNSDWTLLYSWDEEIDNDD